MAPDTLSSVDLLIQSWLVCLLEDEQAWLQNHTTQFDMALLGRIKERSIELLLADPQTTEKLTRGAMLIAAMLSDEPLALPLAAWARGNWELFHHEPNQAVLLYKQALAGYRPHQNIQYTLRLLSNLLLALDEVGNFSEAFQVYEEIEQLQTQLPEQELFFLLSPKQNYAKLLHNVGQYGAALLIHDEARQLAVQFEAYDQVGEIDVNRALTLGRLGRLDEGEQLLLTSRQIAITLQHEVTVARIDMNLGELYSAQQRPVEALHCFQAARQRFTALNNEMELGSVLLREAALLERIGAFGESGRAYAEAQEHFTKLAMWQQVWFALLGNISANRLYGRYDRAAYLLAKTETYLPQMGQSSEVMTRHLELIALTLHTADPAEGITQIPSYFPQPPEQTAYPYHAARYWLLLGEAHTKRWQNSNEATDHEAAQQAYKQAQQIGTDYQDHQTWRQALVGLARLLFQCKPLTARQLLEEAWQQDDAIRQELSVQELKAGYLAYTNEILPLLLRLNAIQGDAKQMLQDVWRAKGSALKELFITKNSGAEQTTAADTELLMTRQLLATQRWEARLHSQPHLSEVELERTLPEIQQLKEKLQRLRRQRSTLKGSDRHTPLSDPLAQLQSMSADFLLEYVRCEQEIWAICADRQGSVQVHCLTDVEIVQDLQDELQFAFEYVLERTDSGKNNDGERWLSESHKLLERLYQLLLAPLGPFPQGSRLLIAPCDSLYRLPFAAFWNGSAYMVEEYRVEMMPTGALLTLPSQLPVHGAPVIIAATAEGKLPAVRDEAIIIHAAFPDSLCLIDQPATVQQLLQLTTPPQFLHIATHTVVSDVPIFTALHLAGEFLAVEQCYELPLQGTELVTLSGCTTMVGMDNDGTLLTLQTAFMSAGAQHVLSTLWPINDAVTSQWMMHFYRWLAAGEKPNAALRHAQLTFIHHTYTHPVFWAPFVCYRR